MKRLTNICLNAFIFGTYIIYVILTMLILKLSLTEQHLSFVIIRFSYKSYKKLNGRIFFLTTLKHISSEFEYIFNRPQKRRKF